MQEWFSRLVKKLVELPWFMWAIVAGLLAFGIVLMVAGRKTRWTARMLAHAAICLALSFVLSCIRLWRMPQGGSITPGSMLPLMMFAYAYGTLPGLLAGVAYGLLQILQGAEMVHPLQLLLDYVLAFGVIGLAGCLRGITKLPENLRFTLGVIIAGLLRTLCSTLSGAVFFAEYTPAGQNAVIYSLVYNLTSLGIDTFICAALAAVPKIGALAARMKPT